MVSAHCLSLALTFTFPYRASERSPFDGSCCGGGYTNVDSLPTSPTNDSMDEPEPSPR